MSIWDQLYEAYGLSAVFIVVLLLAVQLVTLAGVTGAFLRIFLGRI